jgi:hypothetical protein
VLKTVKEYLDMGMRVIPIPLRTKVPIIHNWQNLQVVAGDVERMFAGTNVGVVLGPSGLVDIDLDHPAAVTLAPKFLPPTKAVFGRPGKPRSHWIYSVRNPLPKRRFPSSTKLPTIVEYRSENHQSVFPPSIHETGEQIAWDGDFVPADVDGVALMHAVEKLAEAVLASQPGNLTFDATRIAHTQNPEMSAVERCRRYLEKVPDAVSGQGGHAATLLAACECFRFGLSQFEAWDVLRWFNDTKCQPVWNEKELRHKLTEGEKLVRADGKYACRLTEAPAPPPSPIITVANEVDFDAEVDQDENTQFPADLLSTFGIVGEIANWITATAPMPQPILSLAAALAWCGTIVGRKVQTPSRLRTNLYCLGVAESGCGKDHPRKMIKLLAEDMGPLGVQYLGGETIASDSGLISAVAKRPSVIFPLDEIGYLLQSMTTSNAPPHLRNIGQVLLSMFSSSSEIYLGKEYAGRDRIDIQQPNVSFLGTTQRNSLHRSITPLELASGLLPRMLVFYCPLKRPPLNSSPSNAPVPENVRKWHQAWVPFIPKNPSAGNIEATRHYAMPAAIDPQAEMMFQNLHTQNLDRNCPELWTRAAEHARKIALITAAGCSNAGDPITIAPEIAQWSCRLIEHCVGQFAANIMAHVSEGEYERDLKRIRAIIFRKKNGVRAREISRETQNIQKRRRDEILMVLQETGEIQRVETKSDKGPTTAIYKALREGKK